MLRVHRTFCFSIQKALTEELIKGRLNAILDVTTPEPLEYNSILWDLEIVFLTPHIAGSMGNEVNKMSEFMIEEVNRFNNKQNPCCCQFRRRALGAC